MRKALTLILVLLAGSVSAQVGMTPQLPAGARPSSGGNAADDTSCAILVRAITGAGATIEVATVDLVLTTDGTTADADVAAASGDCGATPGTLDTGNAACDTVGELCDQINESASWRCALVDSLRADSSIRFNTLSEVAATGTDGVCLLWDTSVAFDDTHLLAPPEARKMPFYLTGPAGTTLKPNPFAGLQTQVSKCTETSTYASGTSFFQIIDSAITNGIGTTRRGTEATALLWNQAGGATTASKDFDFQPGGVWNQPGNRVLSRIKNSAAQSVINEFCSANTFRATP